MSTEHFSNVGGAKKIYITQGEVLRTQDAKEMIDDMAIIEAPSSWNRGKVERGFGQSRGRVNVAMGHALRPDIMHETCQNNEEMSDEQNSDLILFFCSSKL